MLQAWNDFKYNLSLRRNPRRGQQYVTRIAWSAFFLTYLTCLVGLTWLALILTVTNRLRISQAPNGLQHILQAYQAPDQASPAMPTWAEGFSDGVAPVQCHSHNDYWHHVPLYEGLAAGCVSTEVDIWIGETTDGQMDLFVGHDERSLTTSRTLKSLYLDPLFDILYRQNSIPSNIVDPRLETNQSINKPSVGTFVTAPDVSFILILDFKTASEATWDTAVHQLDRLRAEDWLTYWTPTDGLVQRPLTIVASGKAPFNAVVRNTTYRDIFYDAPLLGLGDVDMPFNQNNSYYASAALHDAVGAVTFGNLNVGQKSKVAIQVKRADGLGLKSRYWGTPSWPVGWRNRIWGILIEGGAHVINVDDLTAAARWDWQMCVVGGLNICNS